MHVQLLLYFDHNALGVLNTQQILIMFYNFLCSFPVSNSFMREKTRNIFSCPGNSHGAAVQITECFAEVIHAFNSLKRKSEIYNLIKHQMTFHVKYFILIVPGLAYGTAVLLYFYIFNAMQIIVFPSLFFHLLL